MLIIIISLVTGHLAHVIHNLCGSIDYDIVLVEAAQCSHMANTKAGSLQWGLHPLQERPQWRQRRCIPDVPGRWRDVTVSPILGILRGVLVDGVVVGVLPGVSEFGRGGRL